MERETKGDGVDRCREKAASGTIIGRMTEMDAGKEPRVPNRENGISRGRNRRAGRKNE
jgi:hypothetical protein